jgi:hypothetical protein
MAEPNLDLGLDYTGGINKPLAEQVGSYARVAVDSYGDPNLDYVTGVDRRLYFSPGTGHVTVTTAKTTVATTFKIPAGKFLDGTKQKIRVEVHGEWPARANTKIGVDFLDSAPIPNLTEMDLLSASAAAPFASTPFVYVCEIYPSSLTSQRVFSNLRIHGLVNYGSNVLTGANMNTDVSISVTGQLANAADTLLFRRVEVYGIGF